jgi:hypothetical protein
MSGRVVDAIRFEAECRTEKKKGDEKKKGKKKLSSLILTVFLRQAAYSLRGE